MYNLKLTLICCGLLAAGISRATAPQITIPKTENAPVVNGKLNDRCWKKATAISNFTKFESSAKAKKKTTVLLTYDDKNLYIAFKCHEKTTKGLRSKYLKRDSQIWMDDCIEFLLDNGSKTGFYHFAANAKGGLYDDQLEDPRWNSANIQIGTDIKPEYWIIEFSIPLREIGINFKDNKKIEARFTRCSRIGKTEHSSFPPASRSLFFRSKLAEIILK